MLVHKFSALLAALIVLSARLINSFIFFDGVLSEFGEINIWRIFLFSSSCMGLTGLFEGFGDVEPIYQEGCFIFFLNKKQYLDLMLLKICSEQMASSVLTCQWYFCELGWGNCWKRESRLEWRSPAAQQCRRQNSSVGWANCGDGLGMKGFH